MHKNLQFDDLYLLIFDLRKWNKIKFEQYKTKNLYMYEK